MVVQKFGGTSVGDAQAIRRLIEIVGAARRRDGGGPVVVVSAMSGVTDALLALAAASLDRPDEALASVEQLRQRHDRAARELAGPAAAPALHDELAAYFRQLEAIVRALGVLRETSPRSLDAITAIGELLSSRLVAAALAAAGVDAAWVDARRVVITGSEHMRAAPLMAETAAAARAVLRPLIAAGQVPVVGGFVGATPDGHTTTLGRGGSDYSGAIIGACLEADEIQIWTDVDGMLTADPRLVSGPRLVPRLSYDEAAELAYFGAKVLHPSTIRPAVEKNIPVRILNSWKPEGTGTRIAADSSPDAPAVAALAAKRDVTVVDVTSSRMLMAYGFLRQVFSVFERYQTAVDVVTTSEVSVSVTIDDHRHLQDIVSGLRELGDVCVESGMALLCAVGDRLRQEPAIAARVVAVLEEVPLRMISQAASRRNITVIMRQEDLPVAMQRLHEELFG